MARPADTAGDRRAAPTIEISNGGSRFGLTAWSACINDAFGGSCWDGAPPADPVDVGVVMDQIHVMSGKDGWHWQAMARQASANPEAGLGTGDELPVEHSNGGLPPSAFRREGHTLWT
ncbi:hypothetical protein GCM10009790_21460 [Georgenia ruanii]